MVEAVIFDLDGTLVDSTPVHKQAWKDVAEELGMKVDEEKLLQNRGLPIEQVIANIFNVQEPQKIESILQAKFRHLHEHIQKIHFHPHVETTLKVLKEKGFAIGICTASKNKYVNEMWTGKLDKYFERDHCITANNCKKGKPDAEPLQLAMDRLEVDPKDVLYIGDGFSDYQCAENAGVGFLLYVGEHDEERVPAEQRRIKDFSELFGILEL